LYGHKPRHFGIDLDQDCAIADLENWLWQCSTITALIQQQLLQARQRMKNQANNAASMWVIRFG
jgi:hypothetical protein